DSSGNILSTEFVPDAADVNIRFYLTAVGQTSGAQAQTSFTDAGDKNTNTSLASSANPSTYGQSVTFTASVSGNPGNNGTVTFSEGSTVICGSVPLNSSAATCSTSTLSATTGSPHTITAAYSGATGFQSSTGTVSQTVNAKALTVTGITANNKVYDGTTTATINTANASLVGVLFGDGVTLSTSGATGSFP